MKVTIITVCYNSKGLIRTAMESVLAQTWREIEYLVIDGGSTDDTVEIIQKYEPRFGGRMRWLSEKDRGMYDAINKGLRMATGEIVGILNADDVLADDWIIERVVEAFREYSIIQNGGSPNARDLAIVNDSNRANMGTEPCFDAIYGDVRFVADRREVGLDALRAEPTVRYYSARHWRPWMLQWGFMPPHPSVYIRRACFDCLGNYALDYRIAADYALLIRFLRRARLSQRYVPLCFVDMRVGGVSTKNWRSNLLLNQEIVRGNREAGYFCCLPMLAPKYIFKVFEFVGPYIRRALAKKKSGLHG